MQVQVWGLAAAVAAVEGAAIAAVRIVELIVAAAEGAGSIGGLAGIEIVVEWYMEGVDLIEDVHRTESVVDSVVAVRVDDIDRGSAWLVDAGVVELLGMT